MDHEDFDDLLEKLGLGRWNLFYYLGFSTANFMLPAIFLTGVFAAPSVNFTCNVKDTDVIPSQDECTITLSNKSSAEQNSTEQECSQWLYNDEMFPDTLTAEFDLVCDDEYLRPTFQTVFMAGGMIGSPLNGFLSDKYGRRTILVCTTVLTVLTCIASTFSHNFSVMLVLRFVTGVTAPSIEHSGYVLCLEVCQAGYRSIFGPLICVSWALGTMWWGVLGYLIRDWRWLIRASMVPSIAAFIWLWIIDESPRWLIVNGHYDKALKNLHRAARWNKAELPPDEDLLKQMVAIEKLSKHEAEVTEKAKNQHTTFLSTLKIELDRLLCLYRTPEIRKKILILYANFFVCSAVFFGLTMNAVNFQLDPFMYMVVNGLSEVVGYMLPIPVMRTFGRIPPTVICFFVCGITVTSLAFIPSDIRILIMILAMLGKFSISVSFVLIYLLSSEAIPTEVRLQGLGASCFISAVGATIAPYITDLLGARYGWLPSIIFGIMSLLAGVCSIFFPETLNQHLPETIKQLEMDALSKKNKHKICEIEPLEGHIMSEKV